MRYVSWLPAAYEVAARFAANRSGRSNIYLILLDYSDRRGDERKKSVLLDKRSQIRIDLHIMQVGEDNGLALFHGNAEKFAGYCLRRYVHRGHQHPFEPLGVNAICRFETKLCLGLQNNERRVCQDFGGFLHHFFQEVFQAYRRGETDEFAQDFCSVDLLFKPVKHMPVHDADAAFFAGEDDGVGFPQTWNGVAYCGSDNAVSGTRFKHLPQFGAVFGIRP